MHPRSVVAFELSAVVLVAICLNAGITFLALIAICASTLVRRRRQMP